MKEILDYVRQRVIEARDVARWQARGFIVAVLILVAFYVASVMIPSGVVTYALVLPATAVVFAACLAHVNSIGVECRGLVWDMQRVGLALAGAGAVMVAVPPFVAGRWPDWRLVVLMWGVAIMALTDERGPWRYYISGEYRTNPPPYPRPPLYRVLTYRRRWDDPK